MVSTRQHPHPVTRFAPSPTGYLHLGHVYAALVAEGAARQGGGRFLLRFEDIDPGRCRPEYEAAILEDLAWLGLAWDGAVRRQSEHLDDYRGALAALDRQGLLYPCFCTRAEVMAEIERSGNAPHLADGLGGPDGPVYPGTCRNLSADDRVRRIANRQPHALRLDMARSVATAGPLSWIDAADGPVAAEPAAFGDVVLARKDTPTSYHLAVTVDDHLQGVTLVTRAADLRPATHVHRLLQTLLGFDSPRYLHHRVLTGPSGRRLAKRDNAASIRGLRANGATPAEIRRRAGFEG